MTSQTKRDTDYVPRLVDPLLKDLHANFAAVQIVGPRACGKTTTAARHVAQIDRLDEPGTESVYRLDVDAALRRARRPLLIDEFQIYPEIRAAVKRAVDVDRSPGQFILTGSARAGLDLEFEAATGRLVTLHMHGLTEREIEGRATLPPDGFLSRLARSGVDELTVPPQPPDIDDYIARAVRSGFPEPALRLTRDDLRRRWLNSYVDNLVTRDAALVGQGKDPSKLRAYLQVLALNIAGHPSDKTLYDAAGINVRTASGYDSLLENLYIAEAVPVWPRTGNRLKILAQAKKRYLVDGGLAAVAAGLTADDIMGDADLVGRLFDTFATAQLRAESELADPAPRTYHLRTSKGDAEIDLVFDMGRRRAVGVELKASTVVSPKDARHLVKLRDDLGRDFLAGAVLYSGSKIVELGDRIYGIPLCCIWT